MNWEEISRLSRSATKYGNQNKPKRSSVPLGVRLKGTRKVPYFVSLYHTHAMYANTNGMARLTILMVFRVNSDDDEL